MDQYHPLGVKWGIVVAACIRFRQPKNSMMTGTNISTYPLAAASDFLKKELFGKCMDVSLLTINCIYESKYILACACLNEQADFLSSLHIFI